MRRGLSRLGLATLGALVIGLRASSAAPAAPLEKPVTKPATEITGTEALLNGVLNPKTQATAGYYFNYASGESCGGGLTTEPGAEANGKAIKVSTPITGLTPNAKYTVCVVAFNALKEEPAGAPLSFETLPVKPLIAEESASAVTETTASISALINPESQETTCKAFEYVDDVTFKVSEYATATSIPCEPEGLGSGAEPTATSSTLTGLVTNTTYHIRVLAENGSGLSEGPDKTFLTLPKPPRAETGEAFSITPNGATISGSVNPESVGPNSETTYIFQYGLTTSYGAQIPFVPGNAGQGTRPVVETANVSGLEPGAGYHYRIVATNDLANTPQTVFGEDKTFVTVPTPPRLSAVSVSVITTNSATIDATLDPRGLPTRYELQLGSAPGILQAQTSGNTAASGALPIVLNVESLSPGTVYYFRIIATNVNGAAEPAPEGAFATTAAPGAASPLAQPSTPPQLATPATAFPSEPSTGGAVLGTTSTKLGNVQKLARALKVCRKKPRAQRSACERQARRRYGTAKNRGSK